jgi:uncharacterized membrane protein YccC
MRSSVVAVLLLATASVGACGGGGGAAREDYIARADAVCARLGERADELGERALDEPPSTTPDPGVRTQDALQRALQRATLRQLRALPRPAGDEERLAELYDELERGLQRLDAALARDEPGSPEADPLARFRELAAEYGMRTCAAE